MAKITYVISFPIYGTGSDKVDIDEKELEGKTDLEIKQLLLSKASAPCVCHHCNETVEELEIAEEYSGKNLEHVSYWEEE